MNSVIVRTIFLKELLDTLRDKRTVLAMIGVPVVLYPALSIVMWQFALVQQGKIESTPSKVVLRAEDTSPVREWIAGVPLVELTESASPEEDLAARKVDAVVIASGDVVDVLQKGGTVPIRIQFDATESASREAADRIEDGLSKHRSNLLRDRLRENGLDESFAKPLDIQQENKAPAKKMTGSIFGLVLPGMMIFMLAIGAFYPAVDLTAGEKERGTFETLLSTPASKLDIVVGKFGAVFVLSMLTGLLNLASMAGTLVFLLSQISKQARDGDIPLDLAALSVTPSAILAMLIVFVPLAFIISAAMMTVSLLARSFKEAQNLVTPLFMLFVLPVALASSPDMKLTAATQFIPIANVALLFRALMIGEASLDTVFAVFLCTSIYAMLSLVVAVWMFQRDEVILSEDKGLHITFRRSEIPPREAPTPGMSLGLYTIVMLLVFYVGATVQLRDLRSGLLITEYAVVLAPVLLLLWYFRIDFVNALGLRRPPLAPCLAAVALVPAWIVISLQLQFWQERVLKSPPELMSGVEDLMSLAATPQGLALLIFIMGVTPGICEELLFRGAILSGMRERMPRWAAIAVVALLFGLFHLNVYRLVSTGLTGAVLTWLAFRSRSIFPCILFHALFNSGLVLMETGNLPQPLVDSIEHLAAGSSGIPMPVFAIALAVGGAIIALLERGIARVPEFDGQSR